MGRHDSSATRVVPVLAEAARRDPERWLARLLQLPRDGARPVSGGIDLRVTEGPFWGAEEHALPPPPALLRWLVQNLERGPASLRTETDRRRQALAAGEPQMVSEALDLLERSAPARAWYVLEGHTYPDVYIATPDAVVVAEGKRTEPGPTMSTTWMPVRSQMIRHMDAAWEHRAGRAVLGLFIVEANLGQVEAPPHWRSAALQTLDPDIVARSLPHRSPEEREQIMGGFLGVATWQQVCAEFDLPAEVLVSSVPVAGGGGNATPP